MGKIFGLARGPYSNGSGLGILAASSVEGGIHPLRLEVLARAQQFAREQQHWHVCLKLLIAHIQILQLSVRKLIGAVLHLLSLDPLAEEHRLR